MIENCQEQCSRFALTCATMAAMSGIRARARAQTTDEIKTIARRHLATDGANLSLRAVARDLGVVSSAISAFVRVPAR